MFIFKKSDQLQAFLSTKKVMGQTIGFVPTMGALHAGHISLINKSKSYNSLTVCSIFVNPTQFNNSEDYKKYPISVEHDIDLLEAAGCDILFLPTTSEIYPEHFKPPHYELDYLEEIMEGAHRPGHFQGVCMVVDRLLQIIPCTILYLGKKDYQQCMVIEKMTQTFHPQLQIEFAPTIREADGLAMSSRNRRLNEEDRKKATAIFNALTTIKNEVTEKDTTTLIKEASSKLTDAGFQVDYVEILNNHLKPSYHSKPDSDLIALIAASINGIRLIDNMQLRD